MPIAPDTFIQLSDLIHRFWALVDEQTDLRGEALFTPAGELVIESFRATGQAELSSYFAARRELSLSRERVTRHLCSNLRLLPGDSASPRLLSTITVFSGYGSRPVPLGAPSSLADFSYECHLSGGEWLLSRVEGRLVFTGADTPDLSRAQASAKGAA